MGNTKTGYDSDDVILSAFAVALALPVRVFIVRRVIEKENSATKDDFTGSPYQQETIIKHIQQLKNLDILRSRSEKRTVIYSIDKDLFKAMAERFGFFINSFQTLSPETLPVTVPAEETISFGEYLKTQRISYQLTQSEFAVRLGIDRSLLSKIENQRAALPADKLEFLSHVIHESLDGLKKIYYSDEIANRIRLGDLSDDILTIAKLKAKQ